ncbi:alpha/beta hydrolase [Marinicauda algicola]|uniref:Alpha/beta hydrolase n=1 Tax=Marinicauda algicola TaxID=2029849 RepID=A0A4S2H4X7_9PROT|nr:alpha/beta hydrolase [Marinicauda algicola]TGY90362.1 alpha/beta hydrolase [Marinicauda algicola]
MSRPDRLPPPLIPFKGEMPARPAWFEDALEGPVETGFAEREGTRLAWKAWGERGLPGVLLIHGGTAHKGWWDALGPFLAEAGHRVVAPDLAGMGESGWREIYTMADHASDMIAAGEHAGAFGAGRPMMVGHSFGGFVTIKAAIDHGDRLRAAVLLDSPIRPRPKQRSESPPRRGGRTYPDMIAALARFRLLPEQECDNLWLVDHIARGSLKRAGDGYTWLFDPDLWAKLEYEPRDPEEAREKAGCPLAFMRGAQSVLMQAETWDFMRETFPGAPFITVPQARHHLILDQPLAVAAAVETLLASWARDRV